MRLLIELLIECGDCCKTHPACNARGGDCEFRQWVSLKSSSDSELSLVVFSNVMLKSKLNLEL